MSYKLYVPSYMFYVIGLGNPGQEYEKTRHNVGFLALDEFAKRIDVKEWKDDKKSKSVLAIGKVGKEKVTLLKPQTFMNLSGKAVSSHVKSKKMAEKMVVIHDDLDIGIGSMKISFGKSSGGHKGVESVVKAVKTKDFIRVRIGISPVSPSGKLKKPNADKISDSFIVKEFRPAEFDVMKKVFKKASEAIEVAIDEGRAKAMSLFN